MKYKVIENFIDKKTCEELINSIVAEAEERLSALS